VVFPSYSRRNSTSQLDHDSYLPIPFQFSIIHISSYYRRYIV